MFSPFHTHARTHAHAHTSRERQDNEIAQEIQEELVRQAEQQILQEEKDMVCTHAHSHTLTQYCPSEQKHSLVTSVGEVSRPNVHLSLVRVLLCALLNWRSGSLVCRP